MTRTYLFVGISDAELKLFCATSAKIVKSTSTLTIEIEIDGKDTESLDEFMASRGWIPA